MASLNLEQRVAAARKLYTRVRQPVEVKRATWGHLFSHEANSALNLARHFFQSLEVHDAYDEREEKQATIESHLPAVEEGLAKLKGWLRHRPGRGKLEAVPLAFFFKEMSDELPKQVARNHPLVFKPVGQPLEDHTAWMIRESMQSSVKVLVDNAVRATQGGPNPDKPVVIEHGICPRAGRMNMLIRVRDQGPGLSKQASQNVLIRPYSDYESDGSMGEGLLAVKDVLQDHGGSIRHVPRQAPGAVFEILVPLEKRSQPRES